jgi:excisionase family DNA binding protein
MAPNTIPDSSILVFTVSEVSALLEISKAKIYMMIQEGILDGVKIGFDWRVKRASLERIGGIAVGKH